MALADYQVDVYDPNTGTLLASMTTAGSAEYPGIKALQYSRVLNGVGALSMTVSVSHQNALQLIPLDTIIEVLRITDSGKTVEGTYLKRMHRFQIDNKDNAWLVIGAVSVEHLLARRMIDPDDDPLQAGGYSTKGGAADTVMVELVDEQAGPSSSRAFPEFYVDAVVGSGNNVGGRWQQSDSLLKTLQTLARSSQMDFRVYRDTGRAMRFDASIVGTDRTFTTNYPVAPFVIFDPDYGNMSTPSLVIDRRREQNQIFLMLRGPEDDRVSFEQGIATTLDSPYNRIEFTSDGRQLTEDDTVQEWQTQSVDLIRKFLPREKFEFAPAQANIIYQELIFLGDYATVRWVAAEFQADLRLVEIKVVIGTTEDIEFIFERVT